MDKCTAQSQRLMKWKFIYFLIASNHKISCTPWIISASHRKKKNLSENVQQICGIRKRPKNNWSKPKTSNQPLSIPSDSYRRAPDPNVQAPVELLLWAQCDYEQNLSRGLPMRRQLEPVRGSRSAGGIWKFECKQAGHEKRWYLLGRIYGALQSGRGFAWSHLFSDARDLSTEFFAIFSLHDSLNWSAKDLKVMDLKTKTNSSAWELHYRNTCTLYLSKTPSLYKSTAQFKAVCPPNVHKMPVGRSLLITWRAAQTP